MSDNKQPAVLNISGLINKTIVVLDEATKFIIRASMYLEDLIVESQIHQQLSAYDLANMHREDEEREEQAKRRQPPPESRGMLRFPFGFCPTCGQPGIYRSKNRGVDKCVLGHTYPSSQATMTPLNERAQDDADESSDYQREDSESGCTRPDCPPPYPYPPQQSPEGDAAE